MIGGGTIRRRSSTSKARSISPRRVVRYALIVPLSLVAAALSVRADSTTSGFDLFGAERGTRDAYDASEHDRAHAQPVEAVRAPEYLFEMKGTAPYGRVTYPGAMAAAPDGSIYVADERDHRVTRFDRDGNVLSAWGAYGSGDGQFSEPVDAAVAPDGSVYVSDSGNFRVQRFTADGEHLVSWGREGSGDGEFGIHRRSGFEDMGPGSIVVDRSDLVLVEDPFAERIQVFSPSGRFLRDWGMEIAGARRIQVLSMGVEIDGTILALLTAYDDERSLSIKVLRRYDSFGRVIAEWDLTDEIFRAEGLAVAPDGSLYIVPSQTPLQVHHFSSDGTLLDAWGLGEDHMPDRMRRPASIAVAPDGSVFVGDVGLRRIQRHAEDGTFEKAWAEGPAVPGQEHVYAIEAGPDGTLYAVGYARAFVFNDRGELIQTVAPDEGKGAFNHLNDVAIAPSGMVYLSDQYADAIWTLLPDGTLHDSFAEAGTEPGRLSAPKEIAVEPNGHLLIKESEGIRRWTPSGEELGVWVEPEGLMDLRVEDGVGASDWEIMTVEGRYVVRRDRDGVESGRIDVYPRARWDALSSSREEDARSFNTGVSARHLDQSFTSDHRLHPSAVEPSTTLSYPERPAAAARSTDGTYHVATPGRLRRFDVSGTLISAQGQLGRDPGDFLGATDLTIMPENFDPGDPIPPGAVIVADSENNRLQVFGASRPLWRVELFDNQWLMGYPAHITTTREVDLDWSELDTALVAPAKRFSGRIDRRMYLSDTVEIRLETRGGARMWVGDELVVDEWSAAEVVVERALSMPYGNYLVRLELNGTAAESRIVLDLEAGDVPAPTLTPWPTPAPVAFLPIARR